MNRILRRELSSCCIASVSLTIALFFSFLGLVSAAVGATSSETNGPAGYRVIGAGLTGASKLQPNVGTNSPLTFSSSDGRLIVAFDWAKRQACAYAHDNDPVGPWYEGGEPGRESFCMRDISHQVMGAHALGLARHNLNMLRRFAENISDSRDWCSYWGMTRMNQPRRVDYRDDARFWYCLPANFDVLAACYRMYLWSGDPAYVSDPVFLNFYDRTADDYVERWTLGIEDIMNRPRLLNARGIFDPEDKFQRNRGIPGYDEQTKGYVLSGDVLATQYAAYRGYAYFQEFRGNAERARMFHEKAAAVKALVNKTWWNENDRSFYVRVNKDHQLEGRGGGIFLYHGLVDDPDKIQATLGGGENNRNSAEILYRYGQADAAYARLLDVAFAPGSRREYPETSFTWVGALVNGAMGVTLEAPAPLNAWVKGYWVDKIVRTLPGLGTKVQWAELRNLPIRANEITVRHEGIRKTTMVNQSGPALIWQAAFQGDHETLLVNGSPVKARRPFSFSGDDIADLDGFIDKMNQPVGTDRLTRYLNGRFSDSSRQALADEQRVPKPELRRLLAGDLDRIIHAGPLYDPERFAGRKLSEATADLLRRKPQGMELSRFNRLLLLEAYPHQLAGEEPVTESNPDWWISWVRVTLGAGGAVTVEVPK